MHHIGSGIIGGFIQIGVELIRRVAGKGPIAFGNHSINHHAPAGRRNQGIANHRTVDPVQGEIYLVPGVGNELQNVGLGIGSVVLDVE